MRLTQKSISQPTNQSSLPRTAGFVGLGYNPLCRASKASILETFYLHKQSAACTPIWGKEIIDLPPTECSGETASSPGWDLTFLLPLLHSLTWNLKIVSTCRSDFQLFSGYISLFSYANEYIIRPGATSSGPPGQARDLCVGSAGHHWETGAHVPP